MCEVELMETAYNKVLRQVSEDEGLKEVYLEISPGSSKGDNYVGNVYRVKVHGKRGRDHVTLNLFLKTSATRDDKSETISLDEAYKRENYVYNTVLRQLQDLQEETSIDPGCKFSFIKCYHTSDHHLEELLVLEDLKAQGYVMYDRLKSADAPHTALVMKAIGNFHALSYVMKSKKPKLFEEICSKCPDILFNGNLGKSMEVLLPTSAEMFSMVVKDPTHRTKLQKCTERIVERARAATARPGRCGVLCHGDCWVNNVLFKYQKAGEPTDCRLLDFQLLRYGSPAVDILYFIFCCTDGDFRSKHYFSMLDLYHETLTECLREYSLDVDDFMSKEEFHQEIKDYADYGLICAILTLRAFAADAEDTQDVSTIIGEDNEANLKYPTGEGYTRYVDRANDVVADYVQYGYLE